MKALLNKICFGVVALSSCLALADIGPETFIASRSDKANLEKAVKAKLKSVKSVSCKNAIYVFNGGKNYGVAAVCVLDKQEYSLECLNNMTGTVGEAIRLHPEQTVESELRTLIAEQCSGG
jgi:hypothetical protein